jgi:hypothetical protein
MSTGEAIRTQARAAANRLLVARRDGGEAAAIEAIRREAATLPLESRRGFLQGVAYASFLPADYVDTYGARAGESRPVADSTKGARS